MKIVNYKIQEINPAKYNPRKITERELSGLSESIKKFGFVDPLIVNIRDGKNILVGGHQRLKVAEMLGMKDVPVVEVDLSISEEKALNVALNSPTISGKYDEEILGDLLDEIKMELPDLFDDLNFEDFGIEPEVEKVEGQTDEDEVPEAPPEPITKRGDIWLLGNHRLMCGDSTMIDDVEKLLGGQSPNTMITDPPYGVKYEAGWRAEAKNVKKTEREESSNLQNDDRSDWYDAYILHKGNVAYVWHASAFTDVVMNGLRSAGFEIKAQIIWNKNVHALSRSDYQWKHEPCWYAVKKGANHNWTGDRKQKTVWDVQNVMFEKDGGGKTSHPTQKPVELYLISINNHTNSGEYIYEPFGGSGTSIIAAEKTARRSLTMELDEKYCDVIINRWQNYTGSKAVLESSGESYNDLMEKRDGVR